MLLGLDGAMPGMVKKLCEEGCLPNMARLIKKGIFTEALPCVPVDTPTNWTTIATGAWPGTHGITSFTIHLSGEPLDKGHSTVDLDSTKLCKAEFLWDVAEKAGKKPLVLNYLCSWPSTMKKGILIGGPSPRGHQSWILCPAISFISGVSERAPCSHPVEIRLKKAEGWKNLPKTHDAPLEGKILINFKYFQPKESPFQFLHLQNLRQTKNKSQFQPIGETGYNILIMKDDECEKVYICRGKDFLSNIAVLKVGDWSSWVYEDVLTPNGKTKGGFRFRLNELSVKKMQLELYRTPVHKVSGGVVPDKLAGDITEKFGPYASGHEIFDISPRSPKYNKMYFEHVSQFTNYLADVAKYLKEKENWDILITQIHVQDSYTHQVGFDGIDVNSPDHDPNHFETDWQILREQYIATDKWIGRLIRECADENTLIGVISDHAGIPVRRLISINQILLNEKLLVIKKDKQTGLPEIDWSKTKAYNRPGYPLCYIWINAKGRDPEGIVEPGKEYDEVCNQVITAFYGFKDTQTGKCPIALALKKEDAAMLGHWGKRASDIIYFFQPGYNNEVYSLPLGLAKFGEQEKEMMITQRRGHGTHAGYLPTARLGLATNSAVFILAGPGVKKRYERSRPIRLIDVAPTLSHLLGIPAPAQSEGTVIRDILVKK